MTDHRALITFLFTDIEGSTRRWEQDRTGMSAALAAHDAILSEVIPQHGGTVFKTVGDSVCAAFQQTRSAVDAALAAQRALMGCDWSAFGQNFAPLAVRMALHTGDAVARDADYFGPPLNRAARLLAAGHGGQVLVSDSTASLLADDMPASVTLRDLGEHRLRDLARRSHIYQLVVPDLPSEFAPLVTLDRQRHNLPVQLTSFVGRDQELADIAGLIAGVRLLTLTGIGGTGKTRLAVQAAADTLDDFSDGAWFVDLAPLVEPTQVPVAVADALGLREEPGRAIDTTVADYVAGKRLLIVLDNCEHLLDAAAEFAKNLLRATQHARLLATSREPLNVAGEVLYAVPSLSVPDPDAGLATAISDLANIERFTAVSLFIHRARAAQARFAVTSSTAPAIVQICWRLDGIPLAIELAAARVRHLAVVDIAARLDDRFRLLTGGGRTMLARQQTLRASIDWSHDLLNEVERTFFRRLAVFRSSLSLEAAEAVTAAEPISVADVLELISHLTDKSLVVAEEGPFGMRYRLLETVREYAEEQLRASGESDAVRAKHVAYFAAKAAAGKARSRGPDQGNWLQQFVLDREEYRAAVQWAVGDLDSVSVAMQMLGDLNRTYQLSGHLTEGYLLVKRALAAADGELTQELARCHTAGGGINLGLGDISTSRHHYESALAIWRQRDDTQGIAAALHNLGIVRRRLGDYELAQAYFDESLKLKRQLGDQWGIATSLNSLAVVHQHRGAFATARQMYDECLAIHRLNGNALGIALALDNIGTLLVRMGDLPGARAAHREAMQIDRQLGNVRGIVVAGQHLARIALAEGDLEEVETYLTEADELLSRLGAVDLAAKNQLIHGELCLASDDLAACRRNLRSAVDGAASLHLVDLPELIDAIARYAVRRGDAQQGGRLLAAADTIRKTRALRNDTPYVQAQNAATRAFITAALGDDAVAAAWAGGAALSVDDALAEAARYLEAAGHSVAN